MIVCQCLKEIVLLCNVVEESWRIERREVEVRKLVSNHFLFWKVLPT